MPKFCVKRGGDGTRYAYTPELFARGDMDVVEVDEVKHDDGSVGEQVKPVAIEVPKAKPPAETRVSVEVSE